jgi:Ca2+-binding RTX toxin-like protein
VVSALLNTEAGSQTIQFLFKFAGPSDTAFEIDKVIQRNGDFVLLDGVNVAVESFTKAEIVSALAETIIPAIATAVGIRVPIVAAAFGAAIAGQWLFNNIVTPVLDVTRDAFGVAPTKIELTNSQGALSAGVLYRNGLEGLSETDAVKYLIGFADDSAIVTPDVGSHIDFYVDGHTTSGYDLLDPNVLSKIAVGLGDPVATVAGWSGQNTAGQATSNQNLLVPYFDEFNILQTGALLGLNLPNGTGRTLIALPINAIIFDGKPTGTGLRPDTVVAFGTGSSGNLDLSGYNNVYAYGGLGSHTIRGGQGNNVLWSSTVADYASGEATVGGDTIYGGGGTNIIFGSSGNDHIYGGDGVSTIFGGAGDDVIYGGPGRDTIWGGLGSDTIYAGSGDNVIRAGSDGTTGNDLSSNTVYAGFGNDVIYGAYGDDTFTVGTGSSYFDGGPGTDILRYTYVPDNVVLSSGGIPPSGYNAFLDGAFFTLTAGPKTDVLHSIEKIIFGDGNDTLQIAASTNLSGLQTIDGSGGYNTLDLTKLGKLTFENDHMVGTSTTFKNFNVLKADPGDVDVILKGNAAQSWKEVDFGGADDTIDSDVINLKIDLGAGHDTVKHAGMGSVINVNKDGVATVRISNDILVVGAKATDQIVNEGGKAEHGAIGRVGTDDPWVVGTDGMKYGLDTQGDLLIEDTNHHITTVAGYKGGPGVPTNQDTAGILVELGSFHAERLLDLKRPFNEQIPGIFKLGNDILITEGQPPEFNVGYDPLVLDLTGDGMNLTGESIAAPMFDTNHTGFAVHTGWIEPNLGILGVEVDGKFQIIGEQGGGFAALAPYDTNNDGVIDANDSIWSQLRVWRDLNADAKIDTGELQTLDQAGVASINVASTAQTSDTNAGNQILATGSFTRADGSTGEVDDVSFTTDPFNSQYLGDTSVSAAAATRPNLKGFGTLADLHVAMTLDPTLIGVVDANLANLNAPSLSALRAAALPIFEAWARAVPLLDANGNPQTVDPAAGHTDLPILVHLDSSGQTVVDDFGYLFTDSNGATYYKLASGHDVRDAQGAVIAQPTLADVEAQSGWTVLTAGEIGFVERYLGHPLPVDAMSGGTTLLDAMSSFIGGAWTAMNLEAVRLAVQAGPLSQYFPGLTYDASANTFSATTDQQLTPMYQAIFSAAPQDASGASAWLAAWTPIVDIVLGDFDRGEGLQVTYGYQFASMVLAYESVGLPLTIEQAATALGVPGDVMMEGSANFTGPNTDTIYYLYGGDQTVTAGIGMNNFVMGGTFGHDVIIDDEPVLHNDPSILRFTNVKSTDVVATRQGLDLILDVKNTNEEVKVVGEFTGVQMSFNGENLNDTVGVAQISFADGVLWDMPDIAWAVARPDPTDATILGTPAMDVLDGGVGGDTYLSGGDGSDIYIFGRGYGHDTIKVDRQDPFNNATDYVNFGPGISQSDLTFSRDGKSNDLHISINGTSDTLTILDQFSADYSLFGPIWLDRIEGFTFTDGSSLNWEDVTRTLDAQSTGQSVIYGFDYADTLDPGAGVHYLSGGNEDDTYIFDFGYGFDTVEDNWDNGLGGISNTIAFGPGVTQQDVSFSLRNNTGDLVITLSDGSTMLVKGQMLLSFGSASVNRIDNFQFADGTVLTWNQVMSAVIAAEETPGNGVIYGSDYADTLDPGAGNHYISGGDAGGSQDTYVFGHGYGHDTIDVQWTNPLRRGSEVVSFKSDVSPDDVQWSAVGQDLVIKLKNSNDSLTVLGQFAPWYEEAGVTGFAFADGTTLSLSDVAGMVFGGTVGDDTINVSDVENLRLGGTVLNDSAGNDVYIGDSGNGGHTYNFDIGGGRDVIIDLMDANYYPANTIDFGAGVTPATVHAHLLGTSMVFTFDGTNDRIAVIDGGRYTSSGQVFGNIGTVNFSDGTSWNTAQLVAVADVAPALSIQQNGASSEVDYNIAQGYAYVTLPREQSGTTLTLHVSGINPADVDIQRVRTPDAGADAGAAILIAAKDTSAAGLLVDGPARVNDLQFDSIVFDDGTVWSKAQVEQMLVGQASASTGTTHIFGFDGNDTIAAGVGDDVLSGGNGNDTYVYSRGDGFAQIVTDKQLGQGYVDTLQFTDIASTDVTLMRWPGRGINDLVIAINGQNGAPQGQVTIAGQFAYGENQGDAQINHFVFSDGVTWTEADIEQKLIVWQEAQTGASVTVYGFGGGDTLTAGQGTHTLIGGLGADTYVWTAGDGPTWISDQGDVASNKGIDTLVIHGLDPSQVTVSRNPDPSAHDLILTAAGQSPIMLQNQTASGSNSAIERVVFDNGTVWDDAQLLIQADGGLATAPNGTTARAFDGTVHTLNGTAGDDEYFFGVGSGNSTINEGSYDPWQKADTVQLVGLNPGDVIFNLVENSTRDLRITIKATGETLTVASQFYSASHDGSNTWPGGGQGIEQVVFADGTTWDPQQILDNSVYIAAPGSDTLSNLNYGDGSLPMQASAGVTTIYGRSETSDTLIWSPSAGSSTFYDGTKNPGTSDTLRLTGVAASAIKLARVNNDLVVTDIATGDSITVKYEFPVKAAGDGIDNIVFDDGTVWNRAYLNANAITYGTPGDDTIYGNSGPQIFDTLGGNDTVYSFGGGDTFLDRATSGNDTWYEYGNPGDVNTLRMIGVSESNVRLSRSGNDLVLTRLDSGKSITVKNEFSSTINGVEQVTFDDGPSWDRSYLRANAEIYGTSGDDTLNGTGDPEIFDGLGGNDTYYDHSNASDIFIYASSYGNDTIDYQAYDAQHGGSLRLTDLNPSDITLTRDDTELYITVTATGKIIHDLDHFAATTRGISQIQFADGTTWDRATIDANAHVHVQSGPGDYVLNRGSGHATVFSSDITGSIFVADNIPSNDVILQADNSGNLTVLLRDSGDSLRILGDLHQRWWGVSSDVATITYAADGTTQSIGQQGGQPFAFTWLGTSSNTVLTGSNYGTNVFDLGPGGDTITGGNSDSGNSGVNILQFEKGDGHATADLTDGTGIIQMAADISTSDVVLQGTDSGNLTVLLRDTGDSITFTHDLRQRYWGASSELGEIDFADGSKLSVGQQNGPTLTFTWIGTAANTTLTGSSFGTNVFELGSGSDTIVGGNSDSGNSGLNILKFEKGIGHATTDLTDGTGIIQMAADISASDVILQGTDSGNLTVLLRDTGDSITFTHDLRQRWWGVSSEMNEIDFADGTKWSIGQNGLPEMTFTWVGTASNTTLTGSSFGTNVFELGSGNDTIVGGNTDSGNSGLNIFKFEKGIGHATASLTDGTGIVQIASDISASDVILQGTNAGDLTMLLRSTGDSITFTNDLRQRWWGVSSEMNEIDFADGSKLSVGQQNGPPITFTWVATSSNTVLTGSTYGNNVFVGDASADTLIGGGGYDTYKLAANFTSATIENADPNGSTSANGEVDFGAGANSENMWFLRSGNDLRVDLLGTNSHATIQGWYGSNGSAQVQSFKTTDGLKLDSQLSQLVSAMATYSVNNPGFDPTAATQMPTDTSLQSAISAAWHS